MSGTDPRNPLGNPTRPPPPKLPAQQAPGQQAQLQQAWGAALPRTARLTKPSEFKRVFQGPMTSADRWFKVLAQVGAGQGPRLGMAVSRQVDRKATGRNRIKRVIRESFRRHFAAGGPPVDFVVLPRRECVAICNGQLFQSLSKHWARLVAQLPQAPRDAR